MVSRVDVSVIIPARNQQSLLPAQLRALDRQRFGGAFEVLVVDNGSSDATAEVAVTHAAGLDLRVVDASGGRGVNHARNVGARVARGDLLAYVDADDEVADGWLSAIVAAGDEGDIIGGALDQRALNRDDSLLWQPELTVTGLPTALGFLPFAVGANMAVRSEVLAALGGWDERYRFGGNDVDLSWRAQLAGYRLVFAPDAVARYRHRTGCRAIARRAMSHDRANVQLYRAYRQAGAQSRSWRDAIRAWGWLVVHAPEVVTGTGARERWCRELGAAAGRVVGSIEHRVAYL